MKIKKLFSIFFIFFIINKTAALAAVDGGYKTLQRLGYAKAKILSCRPPGNFFGPKRVVKNPKLVKNQFGVWRVVDPKTGIDYPPFDCRIIR